MSYADAGRLLQGWSRATVYRLAQPHACVPDQTSRARCADRFVPAAKRTALLTVTVEEADVLRVRQALDYSGVHAVEFVKLTRVPGETRVRLQIGLDADAVNAAMSKIMGSVDAAEFGRISVASR